MKKGNENLENLGDFFFEKSNFATRFDTEQFSDFQG